MTGLFGGAQKVPSRAVGGLLVAVVVAFSAMALVATPAHAQSCSENPDIQVDQDACSETLAVSMTGNASGTDCTGQVSCVSVSGTGNASNVGGFNSCGTGKPVYNSPDKAIAVGCVAASGAGSASNDAGHFSCGTGAVAGGVGCVAVSGVGNASNSAGGASCGVAFGGVAVGCLAVSGTGSASNDAGDSSCGSSNTLAAPLGCVAVSVGGDSSNHSSDSTGKGCGGGSNASLAIGCVAISGLGDATNDASDDQGPTERSCGWARGSTLEGVPVPSTGAGCVAVSGAGNASNTAGDNSCGDPPDGTPAAAIGCVEVDGQDPPSATVAGAHGCVVTAGSSCTFEGNGAVAPNGVISATSGSWTITHQAGSTTVTDVSGSGPNAFPFPFAAGVVYTLTVGADGSGVVAAGSPM